MKQFQARLAGYPYPEYEGVVFTNGMTVVVNIGLKVLGMEVFPTEEAMRANYAACRFTWLAGPPHPQKEAKATT